MFWSVVMLNVVVLSVIMLNVIVMNVVALTGKLNIFLEVDKMLDKMAS
jgi:hypothetical protein